jgi:predicted porin
MQKKLIALAVVGALAAAPAMAQTNVTVYGSVDMGFSHRGDSYMDHTSSKNSIDAGQMAGSRLGFKGVEDLGNGLKALFTLEAGFDADTGEQAQGGRLFGRQAFVGLTGDFGTAIAGRLYTPHWSFLSALDPFKDGMVGRYSNVMGITGSNMEAGGNNRNYDGALTGARGLFNPQRVDNAIAYVSPTWFGGFNVTAAYSANAIGQENMENRGDNRVFAILPRYTNGPIDIGVSFHQIRLAKDVDVGGASGLQNVFLDDDQKITNWAIGGSYDFGDLGGGFGLKLSAFYDVNKWADFTTNTALAAGETYHSDDIKLKSWMLGAEMPIGKHTVLVSYNRSKLDAGDFGDDTDVRQWALGYKYSLSKRTSVYAAYADISQDDQDNTIFGNRGSVGDNSNEGQTYQNGFQFGINHTF